MRSGGKVGICIDQRTSQPESGIDSAILLHKETHDW